MGQVDQLKQEGRFFFQKYVIFVFNLLNALTILLHNYRITLNCLFWEISFLEINDKRARGRALNLKSGVKPHTLSVTVSSCPVGQS